MLSFSHINLPPHHFHDSAVDFVVGFLEFIGPDGEELFR